MNIVTSFLAVTDKIICCTTITKCGHPRLAVRTAGYDFFAVEDMSYGERRDQNLNDFTHRDNAFVLLRHADQQYARHGAHALGI